MLRLLFLTALFFYFTNSGQAQKKATLDTSDSMTTSANGQLWLSPPGKIVTTPPRLFSLHLSTNVLGGISAKINGQSFSAVGFNLGIRQHLDDVLDGFSFALMGSYHRFGHQYDAEVSSSDRSFVPDNFLSASKPNYAIDWQMSAIQLSLQAEFEIFHNAQKSTIMGLGIGRHWVLNKQVEGQLLPGFVASGGFSRGQVNLPRVGLMSAFLNIGSSFKLNQQYSLMGFFQVNLFMTAIKKNNGQPSFATLLAQEADRNSRKQSAISLQIGVERRLGKL